MLIYLATTVGSIGGGYLSSWLIRKGWPVLKARKTVLIIFAFLEVSIILAQFATEAWMAVALISLAVAVHQAWATNIFTTASDMFPKRGVASIVGLGGFAGALGAMLLLKVTGYVLSHTGSFAILFIVASSAYVTSLLIIHLLVPKLEMAKIRS